MSGQGDAKRQGDPRFSIIIPAFNAAATLQRAIESVLSQSWPVHEIIVIDDGSEDDTRKVAAAFADRVRLIEQTNAGVAVARNRAAHAATGDWLAFLDADDWYYPRRIEWHASWISEDPGLDFLTGDYEYRQEDGSLTGTSMSRHSSGIAMLDKASGDERVVMEGRELGAYVAEHFGDMHTLSVPRATFLSLGGFPPGFRVCEDFHFLARLCAVSHRVGVICRPMGVYLIHAASATRADPLAAQRYNLDTLLDLKSRADGFPSPVRNGFRARLRTGRLNLAYALARAGHRGRALATVAPSVYESPGWGSVRNILSILKG